MPTSGIRVLVVGLAMDLPGDYVVERLDDTAQIYSATAQFQPDVILTSDFRPGALNKAAFAIRKRWLHIAPDVAVEAVVQAIEHCYQLNLWTPHPNDEFQPLVSVYTAARNTGDYLRDTYQSLRDQTYTNWEWVVVDDCSEDATWARLEQLSGEDLRVRAVRLGRPCGRIGGVKDMATRLARGEYLVELDHDDMLTDSALAEVVSAFRAEPDVGMVYSNYSGFFEDGTFHRYATEHDEQSYWSDRYREEEYKGRKWLVCEQPDIYDRFGPEFWQQFGWFLTMGPNHVRAYRASTLRELGGYNPELPVADDWDLYVRFFLRSKCRLIPKLLYLYRFRDNWSNATFVRNQSIQDHLELGRKNYAEEAKRFNEQRTNGQQQCSFGEPTQDGHYSVKDLSFIVLEAADTPDLTERCLRSIRRFAPGAEIVLIANGVPLRADLKTEGLADQMFESEVNLGFAAGSNLGAGLASRPLLCFFNNDAVFVDDTPRRLVESLSDDFPIVAPYSNAAKPPQGDVDSPPERDCLPETVAGLCLMLPAALFKKLGGFDPRFQTWEDDDLCVRARKLGFRCKVVSRAWVDHDRHATFEALGLDVQRIMASNRVYFQERHPGIRVVAIAKDEENVIEGFFEQFRSVTEDWCLLDTGSSDGTVDRARKLGVRVESRPFEDFAQARNMALDLFSRDSDWIIMLDPDERLDEHTIRYLREALANGTSDIYLAPLQAVYPNERREFVPKPFVFRNTPDIRWIFKVHEKLVGSSRQALVANARIDHLVDAHDAGRRRASERLYQKLAATEPYYSDRSYKEQMRERWPLLDYDHLEDERILRVCFGPLTTVVIPTYKRTELLRRALDSVMVQDYVNLDIVVVHDGDDVAATMDRGATQRRPCVREYWLPRNHGAGGAVPRNYALWLRAGTLVAYLDDDNLWERTHASSLYAALRVKDAAFAFSSMKVIGRPAPLIFDQPRRGSIDTSCILHRGELIDRYGAWKDRKEAGYAHDWEMVERWLLNGEKWVATRKPTLLYNADTSGQSDFLSACE